MPPKGSKKQGEVATPVQAKSVNTGDEALQAALEAIGAGTKAPGKKRAAPKSEAGSAVGSVASEASAATDATGQSKKQKRGKVPQKPVAQMDIQEKRAAWGRLSTALKKPDTPQWVKDAHAAAAAIPGVEGTSALNKFLATWVDGTIQKDPPKNTHSKFRNRSSTQYTQI